MTRPDPIAALLDERGVVVLDGAMATELERRGADLDDPLWSARILLEAPALVRAVHGDYFEAGADVAITASYQATFEGLARRGLPAPRAREVLELSVRLAREARDASASPHALVAASVGPYGAYLADGSEYRGDYGLGEAELARFHAPRLDALLAAGPDLVAFETIPALVEARAQAALLAERPGTWATFTFTARDARRTSAGDPLAECARFLDRVPGVAAIGVNCVAPELVPALVGELRKGTGRPIAVYPNSGETWSAATRGWTGERAGDFGDLARTWFDAGARLAGGCCRTTPGDVRRIALALTSGRSTGGSRPGP